jgi:monoamine oxidase
LVIGYAGTGAPQPRVTYTVFYLAASGNEENQGTFERNFNTKDGAQEKRFAGGAHLVPSGSPRSAGAACS